MTAKDHMRTPARITFEQKSKVRWMGRSSKEGIPDAKAVMPRSGLSPNSFPTGRTLGPELSVVYVNDE